MLGQGTVGKNVSGTSGDFPRCHVVGPGTVGRNVSGMSGDFPRYPGTCWDMLGQVGQGTVGRDVQGFPKMS